MAIGMTFRRRREQQTLAHHGQARRLSLADFFFCNGVAGVCRGLTKWRLRYEHAAGRGRWRTARNLLR